jgi:hypothetical protein
MLCDREKKTSVKVLNSDSSRGKRLENENVSKRIEQCRNVIFITPCRNVKSVTGFARYVKQPGKETSVKVLNSDSSCGKRLEHEYVIKRVEQCRNQSADRLKQRRGTGRERQTLTLR